MNRIAFQMLIGDRIKYIGMIVGVVIASFLMNQQLSIFWGLMSRTYGFITDTSYPDLWVMDPKVQFVDDAKPLQDTALYRVRGIEGVAWAVPMYKGWLKCRLPDGTLTTVRLIGIDDATLARLAPPNKSRLDVRIYSCNHLSRGNGRNRIRR